VNPWRRFPCAISLACVIVRRPLPRTGVNRDVAGGARAQAGRLMETRPADGLDEVSELVEFATDGMPGRFTGRLFNRRVDAHPHRIVGACSRG
jgi:hypothetical protein